MRVRKVIGEPPDRVLEMAYADAVRLIRVGQAEPVDDGAQLPEDIQARFAPPEVPTPQPVAEAQGALRTRFGRRRR